MTSDTLSADSRGPGGRAPALPPAVPQLVVALHGDRPDAAPSRHRLDDLDEVRFGRGPAAVVRDPAARRLTLTLPDPRMSSDHGRLIRNGAAWSIDDPRSKNGTLVNGVTARRQVLGDGDLLELGHTCCLFRVAPPSPGPVDVDGDDAPAAAPALVTFSGELAAAFERLARVATTDVAILVIGETGSGKEVVARAIHAASRRPGAFVAINCGALPESLIEAELFGARKGAFSGAVVDRPGLVRAADGGTLFLDEIAELPAASQAALLRVMQEREVLPVGETRALPVDVRFVAATHRRLDDMVATGGFRDDLYARLHGYAVEVLPLRRRREDLGLLVRALLARRGESRAAPVGFTAAAARRLFEHDWPHNVRELEQTLTAALALAPDRPIDVADLEESLRRAPRRPAEAPDDATLRARLVALLEAHAGNVAAVARELGKERMQIHRWARRFGIDLASFRR